MAVQTTNRAVVVSPKGEALWLTGATAGTTVLCRGVIDETGSSTADLAGRLRTGDRLDRLGAPFAAMLVENNQATIAADHVGFRHVYGISRPGWSAAATSARELGHLGKAKLDLEALSVFRLAGHYLDSDTAYEGVKKLPAAHYWKLHDGELHTFRFTQQESVANNGDAADAHAQRLRELVTGFLDHHDGVSIELSGGLDSRLVLAAVPRDRRKKLTAFTIASGGGKDATVASQLARHYGMGCELVDVAGLGELTPAEAHGLATAAAERLDGLGRPLSAAVFHWAEGQVPQAPRLSGHGGEMARALFGPGVEFERPHPTVRAEVVENYIRRWIVSNDAVPDEVLEKDFAEHSRELAMGRLAQVFLRNQTDWLSALSDFYLRQRMHRFGGITITDGVGSRLSLNPLTDTKILALAASVPTRQLAGSRYAVRVMDRLDPELARIPLGSGLRPIALDRSVTLTRKLGENTWRGFLTKAGSKVMRTLHSQRRAAAGAPLLADLVAQHWRTDPSLLTPVLGTGLISEEWLARLIEGSVRADANTVDFLLNLGVIAS